MHHSVLYHEIITALRPQCCGLYVDGTLGAGGHAWGILHNSEPDGQLLGMDVDPQALEIARTKLSEFGDRAKLVQASYTSLLDQLPALGWEHVDGILLDLGISSMQLDSAERGFSFRLDGPLDMRFDPQGALNAADIVNNLPEAELADLLFRFGEERRSRQIARSIVRSRPILTTRQLADLVARVVGSSRKGHHPATRSFQALRIAVNKELEALQTFLPQAVSALAPQGRMAVIAFHSLEDRLVKQFFRRQSRDCICPPDQPVCTCEHKALIKEITRRPVRPGEAEVAENPRSRSARLRVAEKLVL
jgi:16S rRNA (cytosine1402-N4)-methyltransferase